MRDSNGKFSAGHSGNKNGRPKVLESVRDAAREHTTEAILTLAGIMRNDQAAPAARAAAASSLLDRGWGRPGQSLDMRVESADLAASHLAALREMAQRRKERAEDDAPPATH